MNNTLTYRLKKLHRLLASMLWSIRFNFHYLPLRQAVKLPIWIYKADFLCMKGKVIIDSPIIKTGMIQMGFREASIYPNTGIMWENKGGTVVFHGTCMIGNASYLSIGPKAIVEISDDFRNTAALRLVSVTQITFGKSTRIGWDTIIMDSNFHPLYNMEKKQYTKSNGPIHIGDYNWFGTGCKVMHSVNTPERCIFGMGTTVTRGCPAKPYCIMGGSPIRILKENVMRDYNHDTEEI